MLIIAAVSLTVLVWLNSSIDEKLDTLSNGVQICNNQICNTVKDNDMFIMAEMYMISLYIHVFCKDWLIDRGSNQEQGQLNSL